MHSPDEYAIYDARVAVALNVLSTNLKDPRLFPLVSSRNVVIAEGAKRLRKMRVANKWKYQKADSFYDEYLRQIVVVAKRLDVPLCAIEMWLFARAPSLAKSLT